MTEAYTQKRKLQDYVGEPVRVGFLRGREITEAYKGVLRSTDEGARRYHLKSEDSKTEITFTSGLVDLIETIEESSGEVIILLPKDKFENVGNNGSRHIKPIRQRTNTSNLSRRPKNH